MLQHDAFLRMLVVSFVMFGVPLLILIWDVTRKKGTAFAATAGLCVILFHVGLVWSVMWAVPPGDPCAPFWWQTRQAYPGCDLGPTDPNWGKPITAVALLLVIAVGLVAVAARRRGNRGTVEEFWRDVINRADTDDVDRAR